MDKILLQIEELISIISNVIWPVFIPFLILVGMYVSIQVIFNIRHLTTTECKLNFKYVIPQASVTLGAMMGTGTIIGFLGALSKLSLSGQIYVEAVGLWALIGSIILVPISYCETLIAKIVNLSPREYIKNFVSKEASIFYVVSLILLYVFAIGGVQFSGIDAIMITALNRVSNIQLTEIQRYIYISVPIIILIAVIILNNREKVFIKYMIGMVLATVVVYFIFFGLFTAKTHYYIPVFIERMVIGFKNPTSMLFGIPLGLIFGMQRVIQIAEPGLGTLAMAANKSDASPRVAGFISLILTMTLIVVSIIVTSYIASYGIHEGIITFSAKGVQKLVLYFETVISVTGNFGLIILFIFIVLSGMTTLLGGYFLLNNILTKNKKRNNVIYLLLISLGSMLAVFRFDMIFNILDILLFISIALNITALAMFTEFEWNKYKIRDYIFSKSA
ncbi:MAG: hypothetical protein ACRC3Y_17880 [Romboutsia sp.]|uniref:hypothetical protein n=1 Tax=Romboutsia sp. TaxID=1965302 RepID=UPI003F313745